MIFDKDANFPYPVLTNKLDSYRNNDFILSLQLDENTMNYVISIDYDINSSFIKRLIESGQAKLLFIIKSRDNMFFELGANQKYIQIPKSRLTLSKRTTIQLFVQANEEITFEDNYDLNDFYSQFKDEIRVPKNSLLGYSNTVVFDGSIKKPFDLFEKRLDESINSDIKIDLGTETIIITYRTRELQFVNSSFSQDFNTPYIYMGLQKALYRFIQNNRRNSDEDQVYLDEIEVPYDGLDLKLYELMKKKMIESVSLDNIDEVIYAISDNILGKYSAAVWRLQDNGN